jgi:hypothetical protein
LQRHKQPPLWLQENHHEKPSKKQLLQRLRMTLQI